MYLLQGSISALIPQHGNHLLTRTSPHPGLETSRRYKLLKLSFPILTFNKRRPDAFPIILQRYQKPASKFTNNASSPRLSIWVKNYKARTCPRIDFTPKIKCLFDFPYIVSSICSSLAHAHHYELLSFLSTPGARGVQDPQTL